MRIPEARANQSESEEDKKKKRRLRAFRWMMVTVITKWSLRFKGGDLFRRATAKWWVRTTVYFPYPRRMKDFTLSQTGVYDARGSLRFLPVAVKIHRTHLYCVLEVVLIGRKQPHIPSFSLRLSAVFQISVIRSWLIEEGFIRSHDWYDERLSLLPSILLPFARVTETSRQKTSATPQFSLTILALSSRTPGRKRSTPPCTSSSVKKIPCQKKNNAFTSKKICFRTYRTQQEVCGHSYPWTLPTRVQIACSLSVWTCPRADNRILCFMYA